MPNNGWQLAVAHVYLARGGQLIGEPDPKMLHIDEVRFSPMESDFDE